MTAERARPRKFVLCVGHLARVECDGNCAKAWGGSARPKVRLSDDEDDYEYLADGELGDAPAVSDVAEGGEGKPAAVRSGADMNKWCARACERSAMTEIRHPLGPLPLPDFSQRVRNRRPR